MSEQHRLESLCHPFDLLAARYDEVWTTSAIGRAQRDQVWRHIDPLFQPDDRILDIGCGTGEDAAHFVARGLTVVAADPSPAMLAIARRRLGRDVTLCGDWRSAARPFDGAISNFGALNCIADLRSVARDLARLVRPGARLALCVIGRFCLWESFYVSKALRRLRGSASSRLGITVYYPAVRAVAAAFAPEFALESWTGIGLFVPPSYVRAPAAMVRVFAALDRVLAGVPPLRSLADHRLLILVRK